jgi:hypothetical protein
MTPPWTRRDFLIRSTAAVAAIQTLDHLDPCCAYAADAETSDKELFELRPVADGVYAAIAAPRYNGTGVTTGQGSGQGSSLAI